MQCLVGRSADNLRLGEGLQRCERMRRTQRRDGGAVAQLEILRRVFNIYQATLAVFGVNGARHDQLVTLALAQLHGCLQCKRLGTVDKGIAEGFDGLSEGGITSYPAQFDQGLAFKGRGLSTVAIVLAKGVKTGCQWTLRTKGTQAQVDLKGPRASRHNEIEELLNEQLGILTDGNLLRATGLPLSAIDTEHFQ